jgi:hypothetical protein
MNNLNVACQTGATKFVTQDEACRNASNVSLKVLWGLNYELQAPQNKHVRYYDRQHHHNG